MAQDNFLQIKDIKGESTDDKHKDWIEVLSFNWGVSQQAAVSRSASGGGGGASRCDLQDLSIVKMVDSSTPLIFKACAMGKHIPEVKLELCRAGGNKEKYMEYLLNDVVISSQSLGGGGGGELTESITFNYAKIKITYTKMSAKGTPAGQVDGGWDLAKNKDF